MPPPSREALHVKRIAVVCLGNICRSPMAQVILEQLVADAGLDVEVVSAGTDVRRSGEPADDRAATILQAFGYDPSRHQAQQFDLSWFDECDLVLAMDARNRDDLDELTDVAPGQLRLFRSFDPQGPGDVPDPFFGDEEGFREVFNTVVRTSTAIVARMAANRQ